MGQALASTGLKGFATPAESGFNALRTEASMTLRTRLIITFFAISVIPLSAVTLFSYYSSERALRRAAEEQASTMSAELGRRMEWVTADLERRMDRVWPMPEEERTASGPPQRAPRPDALHPAAPPIPGLPGADVAGHIAVALGDAAPMIESLEIMPGPRRPPSPPGVPPPPAPGLVPDARSQPQSGTAHAGAGEASANADSKVIVEMSRVIDKAMEPYRKGGALGPVDMAAWSRAMQERVRQGEAGKAEIDAARSQLEAALKEVESAGKRAGMTKEQGAALDRLKAITEMKGADVDSSVRRDGREVGRIHARLNMPRVFRTILPARRDEGEVAFAIDGNGEIHAPDADKPTISALKAAGIIPMGAASVRSGNDWVVVTRKGPGGMTFGTARPLGRDLAELRAVAARNFGVGFGLIALVFFGSVPLAVGMTRNLRTLMQGVQAVAHGNLSARVPVRSNDEFGRLAAAFNQMTADLSEHEKLVVQQERLQRELELCRQIQNDMLPREPLRLGLAEVKGVSIPAREVGGDFFNYFVLPSGDIAVLVGDVSGKGVGAALLMANVQATLRARLPLEQNLGRLAGQLDADLYANTPPEVYLTMFVGIVNPETRVLRYVNAGHNTQFVLRRGAGVEPMPSTGRPLGLLPGGGYEEWSTHLPMGDLLFFYTDGIVEAENQAGEQFGMGRLEAALVEAAAPGSHVDEVLARVEDEVRRFRDGTEPSDDATVMALRLGE